MPVQRLSAMSDAALVATLGVVALVITAIGAFVAPSPNAADSGTSSFSAGPLGTKAVYVALRELGYAVERSHEPFAGLTVEPERTVILVGGAVPPSESEIGRAHV